MSVEIVMYFILGFLIAGLLALMVAPALWRRAVRLTRARIEAATPMTMSEFRADKDQLRAEFAVSTRRLEAHVEDLRARLAAQLGEIDSRRSEAAQARADRDQHIAIAAEKTARTEELQTRVHELERAVADLSQRLRMRERAFADLQAGQSTEASNLPDIDALYAQLEAERRRANLLEDRLRQFEQGAATVDAADTQAEAAAELRHALAEPDRDNGAMLDTLSEAERQLAGAESRLNALLGPAGNGAATAPGQSLAHELSQDDAMGRLHDRIVSIERAVGGLAPDNAADKDDLRRQLDEVASSVSHLVYDIDGEDNAAAGAAEESLFDRVRKFAGDGFEAEVLQSADATPPARGGSLASRIAALRDLQTTR